MYILPQSLILVKKKIKIIYTFLVRLFRLRAILIAVAASRPCLPVLPGFAPAASAWDKDIDCPFFIPSFFLNCPVAPANAFCIHRLAIILSPIYVLWLWHSPTTSFSVYLPRSFLLGQEQ
jgi:hypothetical protein